MIRAFLTRLLSHCPIEFEPERSNWPAWRAAVKAWRTSSEDELRRRAITAVADRRAEQ